MNKRRFYYNQSIVYGWCVYDRQTNMPAYEACSELIGPVRFGSDGTVYESPLCDNEYKAMRLCNRLNAALARKVFRGEA